MSLDYFRQFPCAACLDAAAWRRADKGASECLSAVAGSVEDGGGSSSSDTGSSFSVHRDGVDAGVDADTEDDETGGHSSDASGEEDPSLASGSDL